jgi:hypothetical protein
MKSISNALVLCGALTFFAAVPLAWAKASAIGLVPHAHLAVVPATVR